MHIGIRVWPRTPVPAGGPQTKYSQGCEPKTESRFFRSVFLGFSRPKTDFLKSVFRLPKKTKKQNRLGFFRSGFFSLSRTPITPTYLDWNPVMYGESSSPRRQQHAEEQHGTGITFFYIPGTCTGIGIMASYPPRGLYNSTLHHPILFTQDLV